MQINFNKQEYCLYKNDEEHIVHVKRRFHNSKTLDDFYEILSKENFSDKELVRPSWDTYFMKLAELAA